MKKILYFLMAALMVLSAISCKKEKELLSLSLSANEFEMSVGEMRQLYPYFSSGDATNREVQWSSDNPEAISVSESGLITALKEGKAIVKASCGNAVASCNVSAVIPVQELWFQYGDLKISMNPGDILTTAVRFTPTNATDRNNFLLWNSNPEVATMETNVDGSPYKIIIEAKKVGLTTLTAECGGKQANLFVYVEEVQVSNVTLNPDNANLTIGNTTQLTATVTPTYASVTEVSWASSNPDVATVENGLVTARRAGTATITACCGEKSATCAVKVMLPDRAVDLGLSVLWSSANLGAATYSEPGFYVAWGELSAKSTYSWETYTLRKSGDNDKNITFTRYNNADGKTKFSEYEYADDIARRTFGGQWRVPSYEEFTELISNCKADWTDDTHRYMKFTSMVPGYTDRSVYFYADGGFKFDNPGDNPTKSGGYYWTCARYKSDETHVPLLGISYHNYHGEDRTSISLSGSLPRYAGCLIRPVWWYN